jgi:hypothetical protein
MCKFFWCFCFCCNQFIEAYRDSEWCGEVDCSRNQIVTKYGKHMCERCIEIRCYRTKMFCDSQIVPTVIIQEKNWQGFI